MSVAERPRTATIVCRGHTNIRASHHKTLEFTTDHDIGPSATCVLGVQARVDGPSLGRLRGAVRIELSAAGITDALDAVMCQRFCRGDPLIVRRTSQPMARTLAIGAKKTAKDIRRDLVAALADPQSELIVTLREQPSAMPTAGCVFVVPLLAADSRDVSPRLLAVVADADGVIAEDRGAARRWLKSLNLKPPLLAMGDTDVESVAGRLRRGDRLAVLATGLADAVGAAGRRAIAGARQAGAAIVPVTGPAAGFAALMAGAPADPYYWLGTPPTSGRLRRSVMRQAVDTRAVTAMVVDPSDFAGALADLAGIDGERQLTVCLDVGKDTETVVHGAASDLCRDHAMLRPRAGSLIVVSPPPTAEGESTPEDGNSASIERMVVNLLHQQTPTRVIARALADALGISRQEAYARVLAGKRNTEDDA